MTQSLQIQSASSKSLVQVAQTIPHDSALAVQTKYVVIPFQTTPQTQKETVMSDKSASYSNGCTKM